ncbi:MAG: aminoacyl-tRNA deacylase [Marinobacter sp. 34-60-7]|nr:MAG: aminoacyl-tRNA deacylase [Marinobacter sp. 34-60-7]
MTPAVQEAQRANIPHTLHEYEHDPSAESYGLEAAEKTGTDPAKVFKTLVVCLDDDALAVAIIPVNTLLSLKRIARAAGAKKAVMADKMAVQRSTGYVLGGVSPLGQKKRLPTFIDQSAEAQDTLFVSAGRRGLEIELSPVDLAKLTGASFVLLQKD